METRHFSPLDEGAALSERGGWPMNVHLEARIEEPVDPARLAAAVRTALDHHPMTRAQLARTDRWGTQLVWELRPGADDAPVRQGSDVEAFLSEPLPLERSPRVQLLLDQNHRPDTGGTDRIILSGHHAALDGAAAVVLLRTILAAYQGADLPPRELLAAPVAAPDAAPGALGAGLRHVFLGRRSDRVLPTNRQEGAGFGVAYATLGPELSKRLVTARPAGRTVNDVLMAALHLSLDTWNRSHGSPAGLFSVVMPMHRPARGESSFAVGNSTTQATVYSRPDQRSTADRMLECVSTQTRQIKAAHDKVEPSEALSALDRLPLSVRRKLPQVASALTRDRAVATTRLSNLGQLAFEDLGPAGDGEPELTVSSLWFSPPCRPPQPIVFGVTGFGDLVNLTARYCRPDFDQESADAFLAGFVGAISKLLEGEERSLVESTVADDVLARAPGSELPRGLRRTLTYGRLFRTEQQQPEAFYRYLADDTVDQIARYTSLQDARVLDIGGGPGYLADALEAAGARCDVVDYSGEELYLFARDPKKSIIGDGCNLPIADGVLDLVVCSNVLEHVPDPTALLSEAVRVLRPDGVAYIAFTNWFSPWGGHETSPWHYLGGHRAAARYERVWHLAPKNLFRTSLFPVHIGEVLTWTRKQQHLELTDAYPRYLPSWGRQILRLPGLREVFTWNLVLVLRPRPGSAAPDSRGAVVEIG